VEAEATFIAKADGVIAGISLADMIFNQVDPSLNVSTLHLFSHFLFWHAIILLVLQGVLTVLTLLISRLNGLKVMEIMSIKCCNLAKYMGALGASSLLKGLCSISCRG